MSIREEQCNKVCRILDDVLANRTTERDSLIVAVRKAFESLEQFGNSEQLPSARLDLSEYSDKLWRSAYERGKREAQAEQQWIPCSEMMPVSAGIYIVDDYRHGKHWIHTVGYMKRSNSWCEQHGIYYDDKYGRYDKQEDIIAWMPLPEPYGDEQE